MAAQATAKGTAQTMDTEMVTATTDTETEETHTPTTAVVETTGMATTAMAAMEAEGTVESMDMVRTMEDMEEIPIAMVETRIAMVAMEVIMAKDTT